KPCTSNSRKRKTHLVPAAMAQLRAKRKKTWSTRNSPRSTTTRRNPPDHRLRAHAQVGRERCHPRATVRGCMFAGTLGRRIAYVWSGTDNLGRQRDVQA